MVRLDQGETIMTEANEELVNTLTLADAIERAAHADVGAPRPNARHGSGDRPRLFLGRVDINAPMPRRFYGREIKRPRAPSVCRGGSGIWGRIPCSGPL
jgi:hypothetical protein